MFIFFLFLEVLMIWGFLKEVCILEDCIDYIVGCDLEWNNSGDDEVKSSDWGGFNVCSYLENE